MTLTVTPASSYSLESLLVTDKDGNAITVDDDYSFVMPNGNVNVSASFVMLGGVVTLNQSTGGTLSANVSDFVSQGTTVNVTCTASSGYYLSSLSYTTSSGTTDITSSKSFVMPNGNVTVSAVWTKNKYTVSVTQATGGTISTSPSGSVEWGTSVKVTASPSTGYSLSSLTYNGTSISNGGSFTMPQANVTVTGSYKYDGILAVEGKIYSQGAAGGTNIYGYNAGYPAIGSLNGITWQVSGYTLARLYTSGGNMQVAFNWSTYPQLEGKTTIYVVIDSWGTTKYPLTWNNGSNTTGGTYVGTVPYAFSGNNTSYSYKIYY